jgi:uncharacterized protein (DUF4415 family)
MKKTKGVKRVRKATRRKTISLSAAAEEREQSYISIAELQAMYKPLKKPVTLRVDADVLAWFKKAGRGYQTRINRALRKVMNEEKKGSGE